MGRPRGSRNPDFEAKRTALADLLLDHLMSEQGADVSLRALASACGVTPPTLRHYFEDREGALLAAFGAARRRGAEHVAHTATAEFEHPELALRALLRYLVEGWQDHGVGRLHALGLAAGISNEMLGPRYLDDMLEPLLQAFEARIAVHVARGQLQVSSLRHAALQLLAPIVLALLHQHELGGQHTRPLSIGELIDAQVSAFMRLYAM